MPRKLFIESYQPRPFSYAVRRTQNHCAEGILSIEDSNQGALVCGMCSKKSNQNMKLLDLCINVRSQRKKQYNPKELWFGVYPNLQVGVRYIDRYCAGNARHPRDRKVQDWSAGTWKLRPVCMFIGFIAFSSLEVKITFQWQTLGFLWMPQPRCPSLAMSTYMACWHISFLERRLRCH